MPLFFLFSYNEQLTQSLQNAEKELKHTEEKHHKQLNESRTSYSNETNEFKRRIEQLEVDNEQLRREEIVHVEPTSATDIQTITVNTEEREQLEKEIDQLKEKLNLNQEKEREFNDLKQKLNEDIEEYKKKIDNLQVNLIQFHFF
jgi:chromosome segregation ATPase